MPSPRETVAWLGIAGLAALAGYWAGHRSATAPDDELAAVISRLEAIEQRLDAARPGPASMSGPPPSAPLASQGAANRADTAQDPWTPPAYPTPEELAEKRLVRRAELESAFAAEPLDSDWAAATQSRLLQATLSEVAIQSGVAPDAFDARCRSKSCRVIARFDEGTDGGGWADHYILGATGMLSTAETLVTVQPDGSTEVAIYGSGD